jgi:hypothetical protein
MGSNTHKLVLKTEVTKFRQSITKFQSIVKMISFWIINNLGFQITQISCYDANKAPAGCTQWFYGSTTGTINSYNYANLVQLANQQQSICIR